MAYLEEIYQYKTKILPLLFNSSEIVDAIGNKDIDPEATDELINNNIFPFLYIPSTQTEVKTYICFDLFIPKGQVKGDLIKNVRLHFYIFSHQDHNFNKGYSRVDYIQSQIDKILNGNSKFGIDKINLEASTLLSFGSTPYRGKELVYTIPELNQDRCGGWDKV